MTDVVEAGVGARPSPALVVACLPRLIASNLVDPAAPVVCLLTAAGVSSTPMFQVAPSALRSPATCTAKIVKSSGSPHPARHRSMSFGRGIALNSAGARCSGRLSSSEAIRSA